MDMELSALIARAREAGLLDSAGNPIDERTIDLAEQGDASVQYELGQGYQYGHGVERDPVQAVAWYRKAADQGNARAQFSLGVCCRDGVGIIQNHEDAYRWLLKGLFADRASESCAETIQPLHWPIEKAMPARFWAWAFRAGEGVEKDPAKTIAWLRKQAEQGRASAQYDLGQCYEYGAGVERDPAEAGAWYNKAYSHRFYFLNSQIEQRLSTLYDDCSDDDTETVETVALYRKGAEQGFVSAQYHLGRCYQYGAGVERDLVEAGAWYRKAIAGSFRWIPRVEGVLNTLYDDCSDDDTETVETVALYRKGAEQGFGSAQYHLGRCYQDGRSVEKDPVQAVAWYRKAAAQDIFNAAYELGVMYANGRGVRKNDAVAVRWYRKAARQGYGSAYAKAEHNLKVMYADGRAVPEDKDEDGWKHDDATIDF